MWTLFNEGDPPPSPSPCSKTRSNPIDHGLVRAAIYCYHCPGLHSPDDTQSGLAEETFYLGDIAAPNV